MYSISIKFVYFCKARKFLSAGTERLKKKIILFYQQVDGTHLDSLDALGSRGS